MSSFEDFKLVVDGFPIRYGRSMTLSADNHVEIDMDLPIEDARRLLQAIAEEEYPQENFDWERIKLVCSHPEHQHNNFDGSLGVSLTQGKHPKLSIRCYGFCGFGRRGQSHLLSDYLKQLGPLVDDKRAGQVYFFDQKNAARIVGEFQTKGTCRLGWATWKVQNHLQAQDSVKESDVSKLRRIGSQDNISPQKLRSEAITHLGFYDEKALDLTCQLRKWERSTVMQLMAELRIGLRYVQYKDDVLMISACTGILPNPSGSNARALKYRYLKDKNAAWMTSPSRTVKFCEYTRPGSETSPKLFFCEGEMDAVSLRTLYPDARILFPMGIWQYSVKATLDLVPALNLKGKDICLCLDRDLDKKQPLPKFRDQEAYKLFVEAVAAQQPRTLATWMCPADLGKDVNDWQKAAGSATFAKTDLRILVSSKTAARVGSKLIWPDFVSQMNTYLDRASLSDSSPPTIEI